MSGTVSTRWYFPDWMSDPNVRACCLAARGLWMDMLCIASANKGRDHGFVMIAGRKLDAKALARLVGANVDDIDPLLTELELNGVFSVDRRGVVYCRRMVRAEKNRTNGRLGGNPNLLKNKEDQNSVGLNPKALIPEPEPGPLFSKENRVPESKPEPIAEPVKAMAKKPQAQNSDDDWPEDHLETFWRLFPPYRREGKRKVGEKLARLRRDGVVTWVVLFGGVQRYAASNPGEYASAPLAWLNGEKWDRAYGGETNATNRNGVENLGFAGIAARIRHGSGPDARRPAPENLEPVNGR